MLGLGCFMRAFSSCSNRGSSLVAVHRLLTAVTSLVAEHGLQGTRASVLQPGGSVVAASSRAQGQ